MNIITAKVIRISCRVFDAAVNGMAQSQIEGDLVIEDESGILIEGNATAKGTVKNKIISFDGTGCSLKADLLDCEFNGNGDTRLIGTMTGGTFSNGILESQSRIDGGVIFSSLIKGTVANVSSMSGATFDNATLLPSTTAPVNDFNGTIRYEENRDKGVQVSKASFQFTNSDGKYLKWSSGDVSYNDDEKNDGIPFNGEYNSISAKFSYGQSTFVTENATFKYAKKKVEWTSGGAPAHLLERNDINAILLNGSYGDSSSENGFTGKLKSDTQGTMSFENGYAEIEKGLFKKIKAKDCKWAELSKFTIDKSDIAIGKMSFTCKGASFIYDGQHSFIIWKKGTFSEGTWTKGLWNAKDSDWKGGHDEDGNFHDEGDSPRHWGMTIRTVPETGTKDSSGQISFKKNEDAGYDYEERYKIMQQCGMISSFDFTDTTQFGDIEGMFVNIGNPRTEKEHESLDVVYSNGLRVLYHPTNSSTNGSKVELSIASIEFFDPSLIERIFDIERPFGGFKYDSDGNIDTKHVQSAIKNEYTVSRELKERALAIAKSGLYDGIKNKDMAWCKANGENAVKTYKEEYEKCKSMSEMELAKEVKAYAKIIHKWKTTMNS